MGCNLKGTLCLIGDGIIYELAIYRNRGNARRLGLCEGFNNTSCPGNFLLSWRKDIVDDRHLLGMDARFALEAKTPGLFGFGGESLHVVEPRIDCIYRLLQSGCARGVDHSNARPEDAFMPRHPGHRGIEAVVA